MQFFRNRAYNTWLLFKHLFIPMIVGYLLAYVLFGADADNWASGLGIVVVVIWNVFLYIRHEQARTRKQQNDHEVLKSIYERSQQQPTRDNTPR